MGCSVATHFLGFLNIFYTNTTQVYFSLLKIPSCLLAFTVVLNCYLELSLYSTIDSRPISGQIHFFKPYCHLSYELVWKCSSAVTNSLPYPTHIQQRNHENKGRKCPYDWFSIDDNLRKLDMTLNVFLVVPSVLFLFSLASMKVSRATCREFHSSCIMVPNPAFQTWFSWKGS